MRPFATAAPSPASHEPSLDPRVDFAERIARGIRERIEAGGLGTHWAPSSPRAQYPAGSIRIDLRAVGLYVQVTGDYPAGCAARVSFIRAGKTLSRMQFASAEVLREIIWEVAGAGEAVS